MASAYVELSYKRHEDEAATILLAALPTVRALVVGGSPSDLRLPGMDPSAAFCSISFTYDRFRVEPRARSGEVKLNDKVLAEEGVELQHGDEIAIDGYRLTMHEGELPKDPPILDTQMRWKLPATALNGDIVDEPSRPYIEEFQLSVLPHMRSERYAEVQRLAEAELARLIRADELEGLVTYVRYLWWMRVRSARESGSPRALEIAREALDLHADFAPLLVACGTTYLMHRDWAGAHDAFLRALLLKRPNQLVSMHDARLGRILAAHMQKAGPNSDARSPDAWPAGEWNVPVIETHAAGDEVLLWRMAHHGRVFGAIKRVKFAYRGPHNPTPGAEFEQHRWEIFDMEKNVLRRRILRFPTLALADPAILVEAAAMRQMLEGEDREWASFVIDLSHMQSQQPSEDEPPVRFDAHAIAELPPTVKGDQAACVRLWCEPIRGGERINLAVVASPSSNDVVYKQGELNVAVAQSDVPKLSGSKLLRHPTRRREFYVLLPSGSRVRARYRGASLKRWFDLRTTWRGLVIVVVVVSLLRILAELGKHR